GFRPGGGRPGGGGFDKHAPPPRGGAPRPPTRTQRRTLWGLSVRLSAEEFCPVFPALRRFPPPQNPKSESRNPKQIQNPKFETKSGSRSEADYRAPRLLERAGLLSDFGF